MKNLFYIAFFVFFISCTASRSNKVNNKKPVLIKIETDSGTMVAKLYNQTPLHRDNFIKLVKEHFYEGLLFHRVIKDFMILKHIYFIIIIIKNVIIIYIYDFSCLIILEYKKSQLNK